MTEKNRCLVSDSDIQGDTNNLYRNKAFPIVATNLLINLNSLTKKPIHDILQNYCKTIKTYFKKCNLLSYL